MRVVVVLGALLATGLAGCVPYPIYKQLQPAATMRVLDVEQRPIEGATVTLVAAYYPHRFEESRDEQTTDASGTARFVERRQWRTEIVFIHGAQVFFWNWCVRKAGHATFETSDPSAPFETTATAVLAAGESVPCRPGLRGPTR